ncbi:MAG: glycosyltransferase [Gammaproteobacteria bacterium]|nr:glycosyltransferase [Gammaproteobacteria bacterium]
MKLSIVVNFFNMRREAERTLYSMSKAYQSDIGELDYEVIVVDNGSLLALDQTLVEGFGQEFKYLYYQAINGSPCRAMNAGINMARGDYVMCCIDGARILSPGILSYALRIASVYNDPFIYTLGMHLGSDPQNISIEQGYNQAAEDALLDSVDWRHNGYALFEISSVALSSKNGFFSELSESNCFVMKKTSLVEMGGFDEQFTSPGGGLVNLDMFNRVNENNNMTPIMLMGEATFHQYHGGVATNVPIDAHPWPIMEQEYQQIRNKPYQTIRRSPVFFGHYPQQCHRFLNA